MTVLQIKNKKILIVIFIISILVSYLVKSQLGINLSEKYTLSKVFPFKYFSPNPVIDNPQKGILFYESFDELIIFSNWTPIWSQKKGKVQKKYILNNFNNSRCLLINNTANQEWSISYRKYFRVKENEIFKFEILTKLNGNEISANAGIKLFDSNKRTINKNDDSIMKLNILDSWNKSSKKITIPHGVKYIRFRFSGSGKGKFYFDDISFTKVSD